MKYEHARSGIPEINNFTKLFREPGLSPEITDHDTRIANNLKNPRTTPVPFLRKWPA